MCLCVCVINTNTTKKELNNKSVPCVLTKYFQSNLNSVYLEEGVFSHVVCLSLGSLTKFLLFLRLEKISPKRCNK